MELALSVLAGHYVYSPLILWRMSDKEPARKLMIRTTVRALISIPKGRDSIDKITCQNNLNEYDQGAESMRDIFNNSLHMILHLMIW